MRKFATVLCIIAALTMQIITGEAQAASLAAISPNDATMTNPDGTVVTIKGLPAWYQGQDGVTVKPCLDVAACVLIGAPDFNAALPLSYPTNFPSEAFFFNATNANIPVGTANALVVMALEYVFVDHLGSFVPASAPGAVATVFQRLRLVHTFAGGGGTITPAPPANSNFTVVTPWGTTVFPLANAKCVNSGGNTKCSITRDILPPTFPTNNAAALGAGVVAPDSAISTFLRDPAALPGFLGNGAAVASFVGAPAGHANSITVTDPLGQTGTTTVLSTLTGQTIGLDVQPSNIIKLGAATIQTPPVPSAAQTVTVTNTTGNPILFPALATAGINAADFAILPPAAAGAVNCSGATIDPAASCSFDITFTPLEGLTAARSATIAIAPTTVQPVVPVVPPLADPPPVTIKLSGTAQYPLTVAVATTNTAAGLAGANDGSGNLAGTSPGQPSFACSNLAAVTAAGTAATQNCTASFDVGSIVNLTPTATQSPLSLFDGFTGLCSGTGACTVTMNAATAATAAPAVTASFIDAHKINTSAIPAAGGTITPTLTVPHASTPTIVITPTNTAAPRISYRLDSVTDSAGPVSIIPVGTTSFSYTLPPVDKDHSITANFIQQFILTPSIPLVGGTISPATVQTVDAGTTQNFTVTADAGFRIGTVLKDGTAQTVPANAATFAVPFNAVASDHSISASFVKIWNVTSSVTGSGSVDKTGTTVVDQGTTLNYTFTPSSKKFQVGKILLDNVAQSFTRPTTFSGAVTFTLPAVTADKAVSAVFVPSGDLDANGSLDVSDALKALRIFVSLQSPDSTDLAAMKIGPLDSTGVPSGGSGAPDLNDIILILKRVIGAVTW